MILKLSEPFLDQPALKKRFTREFEGLKNVFTRRVARVQTSRELSQEEQDALHVLLLNGTGDGNTPEHAKQIEIAYQPAVMDPEHTAIEKMLTSVDFGDQIEAVKLSTIYAFEGLTEEELETLVNKYLFNPLLHVIIIPESKPKLTIQAEAEKMQIVTGFRELNLRELKELSEARSLYMEDGFLEEVQRKFRDDLQRDPTDAELEYLAQRTSDHCFHTTWKSLGLFKKLKAEVEKVLPKRPDIVSVFVDNSGVMEADGKPENEETRKRGNEETRNQKPETTTYLIKGETHNAPTAIAPVGGVETMHGGCLRDIIGTGQGGVPSMATQVFIVGSQSKEEMSEHYQVDSFLDPLVILRGMIQGVQNYGNPMGVPNFGGRVFLHPKFFGKPLALGICLGVGEREYSTIGKPQSGDIALLVGNPTGRDGIHGATMSSAANTEQSSKKEGASVQIGDPYTERLIMEATPELRPLLRAYGDLGAGGIASCFGEMAEGVGIEIDLTKIPTKYEGLAPWEKLESESQERMGMAVAPENLEKVQAILVHHEIPSHVLGTFTDTKRFVVKHGTETIVDLDYEWLESFPVAQKTVEQYIVQSADIHLPTVETPRRGVSTGDALLRILRTPELADQSMFLRRWDSTVQGKSLRESLAPFTNMPFDQGITVPNPDDGRTQVLSLTVNPWWSANPYAMTQACVAGTVSKQIAAGVKRKKIALCDNFYTPKSRPEIDSHLTEMVRAMTDMMVDLGTPIISGKDSSSGTTKMIRKAHQESEVSDGFHHADEQKEHVENFEISPTICMSAVGSGDDAMKVPPKALQKVGNELYFLSVGISNDASGSVLLPDYERANAFNWSINIQEYIRTIDRLAELIDEGKIISISVVDDGGIFHRIFEMMLGSGLGAELNIGGVNIGEDIDPRLRGFIGAEDIDPNPTVAEDRYPQLAILEFLTNALPGSFIVEVESADVLAELDAVRLGSVTERAELVIGDEIITLHEMRSTWERVWYDQLNMPFEPQRVEPPTSILPFTPTELTKKKVNIVYSPGINCHQEMVRTWTKLGCDANLISVTDSNAKFADADIVVFPGGFADGDYLGSAKVWHRIMETQFKDQMDYLRTGKIPVLGICNGFQLMTRSGFFGKNLRLTFNDSATFEQRWVRVKFTLESANSIWTKGLEGKEIVVPVAHGEGKFVMDGEMTGATISLVYDPPGYPNNPNGSDRNIAGVFAGDRGQFWGGMPHPERAIEEWHYSQHGMLFFENVLRNL